MSDTGEKNWRLCRAALRDGELITRLGPGACRAAAFGLLPGKGVGQPLLLVITPSNARTPDDVAPLRAACQQMVDDCKASRLPLQVLLLSEENLWRRIRAGHTQLLGVLRAAHVLVDDGLLAELQFLLGHARMTRGLLGPRLVTYALVGSRVRRECGPQSDLDVLVVFDDTGQTQAEADALRQHAQSRMEAALEPASGLHGPRRSVSLAVYTLTEVWQALVVCKPILVTMLQDGVPLLDAGHFRAWQRLIRRGGVPLSRAAIRQNMAIAEDRLQLGDQALRDALTSHYYYATMNAAQALLMAAGCAPCLPARVGAALRQVLVEPGQHLSLDDVSLVEHVVHCKKHVERSGGELPPGVDLRELAEAVHRFVQRCVNLLPMVEALGSRARTAGATSGDATEQ